MCGFGGACYTSLLGFLICTIPVVVGALGSVFAALCNFVLAIANGFVAISVMKGLDLHDIRVVGAVFMEGLATVVASFASLAVAWFFIAIEMRKG
jgi:hypothetical protein